MAIRKARVRNRAAYLDKPVARRDGTKRKRGQFKKGNPGRPKGAKDRVPRGVKSSVKAILLDLAEHESYLLHSAIRRGLKAGARVAFPYVQLAAHYVDGKPPDQLSVTDQRFKQDELNNARELLGRKLDRMFEVMIAADEAHNDIEQKKTGDS